MLLTLPKNQLIYRGKSSDLDKNHRQADKRKRLRTDEALLSCHGTVDHSAKGSAGSALPYANA